MRALKRTTLNLVLAVTPLLPTGCVSWPHRNVASRAVEQRHLKLSTAQLEESRDHLEVAKSLYEEIRKQDPSNAECLHRLAVVCTRLNQHSTAEVYFRQANALRPNDPDILADMGYAAFVNKNYAEAEQQLEKSVKLRDGDRRTITNLAIVQAWQRKDDASLATFRRVNGEAEAIRNVAAIQVARGDKEKARKSYDLAQAVDDPRSRESNTLAQSDVSNAGHQQVSDVPPPPAAFTEPPAAAPQLAASAQQPPSLPQAPLPPLPVISPNTPPTVETVVTAMPETLPSPESVATQALTDVSAVPPTVHVPASLSSPSPSCAAAIVPPTTDDALGATADSYVPPPVPPATIDESNQLPANATATTSPQVSLAEPPAPFDESDAPVDDPMVSIDEPFVPQDKPSVSFDKPSTPTDEPLAQIENPSVPNNEPPAALDDNEVMFEPYVAVERAPDPIPVEPPSKIEAKKPSPWRKTESSQLAFSNEHSTTQKGLRFQKTNSKLQSDEPISNVWNICLVTLFEEKRLVSGSAEHSIEYQSQEFRFSSEEALEKFRAEPHSYVPAAGGLDVVAVRNGHSVVKGSLNCALWYRRQLYLFSSSEHAEEFRRHPAKYVAAN